MKTQLCFAVSRQLITFAVLCSVLAAQASPGGTREDGCHVCHTDCERYGLNDEQEHCHTKGPSGSYDPYSWYLPDSSPSTTRAGAENNTNETATLDSDGAAAVGTIGGLVIGLALGAFALGKRSENRRLRTENQTLHSEINRIRGHSTELAASIVAVQESKGITAWWNKRKARKLNKKIHR